MATVNDTHFNTLDQTINSIADHQLALQHAPYIRFDDREPFLPSVVGYTIFHEPGVSPSFPRQISLNSDVTTVIEYAIWWDWDIGHLYELEHVWVFINQNGELVRGEASWHGGCRNMSLALDADHVTLYSEPGKHAFAPTLDWFKDRRKRSKRSGSAPYSSHLPASYMNRRRGRSVPVCVTEFINERVQLLYETAYHVRRGIGRTMHDSVSRIGQLTGDDVEIVRNALVPSQSR